MNREERKHYNRRYSQSEEKKAARRLRDRARRAQMSHLETLDSWLRAQQDKIRRYLEEVEEPLFHWRPIDPRTTPEFYDFEYHR